MNKRLNGEGTFRQRPNGSWEARVAYTDDDGTTKRLSFYGKTRAEAKAKLDEAAKRIEAGDPARDAAFTVSEWCERWLSTTLAASARKPTTKSTFATVLRTYISGCRIGRIPLSKLRPSHVDAWLVELRTLTKTIEGADGERVETRRLTESTIRKAWNCLSVALDGAVRDKALARNPLKVGEAPVPEHHEARFLTAEETTAILAAAKAMDDAPHGRQSAAYPLLAFIAATGVRKGEALALRWDAVDLDAGTAKIVGTLSRLSGELVITSPKTVKSRRTLTLSPGVARLLRSHRTAQLEARLAAGSLWQDSGHVFTTVTGRPVDPSTALRSLKAAAAKAGVQGAAVHTLRHTAATAMLEAGVPLAAVSMALGHARSSITADVYAHATVGAQEAAMRAAAAAVGL
ncbi:site-specific integrase [Microbacterium deminutum]|uniref:Site-specific integrase n=1 Tax=Microbacterium deminutum TaxID=344164 RepID=A0ABN2QFP1_9MICO